MDHIKEYKSLDKVEYNELLEADKDFFIIKMVIQMENCGTRTLNDTIEKR